VISIFLPPLRERKEDIPLLVNFFLNRICREMGKDEKKITKDALDIFSSYDWTGNVRELENAIERAVALSDGKLITPKHLPPRLLEVDLNKKDIPLDLPDEGVDLNQLLRDVEENLIRQALEKTDGVRSKAANLLKLNRTTLIEKMKKEGIR